MVGVVSLVWWGIAFARGEGHGVGGIVVAATMNAVVGLFIVGLKVAIR
jgi:hypothetical protein